MMDSSLDEIYHSLRDSVDYASLRGKGNASFLFIEHRGRAIELSWNGTAWWIEFWERSEDEDAPPIAERTTEFADEAKAAIVKWLVR